MTSIAKSKVLIVDDSPDNLQVLMEILKDDYAVIAATTGEKALALACKDPIPDLIILDVVMPQLDGYAVCTRLKADPQTQNIPVIFVTALSEVGNETKGFALGAVDYMTKPLSPPVVKARIKSHLTLQRLHQELMHKNDALAQATRLKDEFLANMSHELRTPLNAILGLSETLLEEILGALNEPQQTAIATIEKSGQHLLELINDILDLSKISAGKMELLLTPTEVHRLCDASLLFIKQHAHDKQLSVHKHLPDGLDPVVLDERRIRQVLINLLTNAVKFTPPGGQINLHVGVGCGQTWQGNAAIPDSFQAIDQPLIVFQVTDTGIGIAPHDLPRLFQPFTQIDSSLNRQQNGTGLGLSMIKQITELHDGLLAVDSQPGCGSCFTVGLPYKVPPAVSSLPESTTSSSMLLHATPKSAIAPLILLAEDNMANIETFMSYLCARNYRVNIAHNGKEAVAIAQIEPPDIILMDIQMPEMDGLEATRRIRANPLLSTVPIIALTALAMPGDQERCIAAGANQYLSKPVGLKQLTEVIRQFLDV
ncbi:MAG TPA: response regulator [Chroococcidiopsis sp.]